MKHKCFYLLNVFRKRIGYPDLKRAVREQAELFNVQTILLEDKASGTQLIQELTSEGLYAVTRYGPTMDKTMRLHSVSNVIENGMVLVPEREPWLPEFLHELTTFPRAKYDDQADSTSQALDWLKKQYTAPRPGVIEFYRQEVERMEKEQSSFTPRPSCCPACGAACISRVTSQWRCNQCGRQFGPVNVQRGPGRPRF